MAHEHSPLVRHSAGQDFSLVATPRVQQCRATLAPASEHAQHAAQATSGRGVKQHLPEQCDAPCATEGAGRRSASSSNGSTSPDTLYSVPASLSYCLASLAVASSCTAHMAPSGAQPGRTPQPRRALAVSNCTHLSLLPARTAAVLAVQGAVVASCMPAPQRRQASSSDSSDGNYDGICSFSELPRPPPMPQVQLQAPAGALQRAVRVVQLAGQWKRRSSTAASSDSAAGTRPASSEK